ncbi:MAG TPA: Gfo/Idh/MocA family oxidoreductase [Candidatus Nanoarchaeia archaeon]|nr:Gfo/Idh/MocA family oxidoreductase [Candidatus Nanoarchaeia archaeon]
MEKLKIVIFGLGSIGKRHARIIQDNFNHEIYAFRSRKDGPKNEFGFPEIYSFEELDLIKPDLALITNPTDSHLRYAQECAKRGMHLFIEKPLSSTNDGLDQFCDIVKKNKVNVYTAYCLRFHPLIQWLKSYLQLHQPFHITINASSYLPRWRKGVNHLEHYSAFRERGGGIILELSHEIDYLYYLLGGVNKIQVNSGKLSDVSIDAEDYADILLDFSGVQCNLHLNFFSRLNRREIILNFKEQTVIADLIKSEIIIINSAGEEERIKFGFERDDMFKSQLDYFFRNFKNGPPLNGLEEALQVFAIIMKIKEKIDYD